MVRTELVQRSPLRIFERSTHGGVGKGNIGLIVAKKGVGKTACLVHIATDQLLQDKHVIHVTFTEDPHHIVAWYEEIFTSIATRYHLDEAMNIHDVIVKNRIIMNFAQNGFHVTEIEKRIRTLIQRGNFTADTIVIDGYNFSKSSVEELRSFRSFAQELDLELWFSASVEQEVSFDTGFALPEVLRTLIDEIAVIISLNTRERFVHLALIKDHDTPVREHLHLRLDPQVLLIAEE